MILIAVSSPFASVPAVIPVSVSVPPVFPVLISVLLFFTCSSQQLASSSRIIHHRFVSCLLLFLFPSKYPSISSVTPPTPGPPEPGPLYIQSTRPRSRIVEVVAKWNVAMAEKAAGGGRRCGERAVAPDSLVRGASVPRHASSLAAWSFELQCSRSVPFDYNTLTTPSSSRITISRTA
ncbi:hypothetical protein KC333_g166 [Hortaea werneckii]|nr:hypothetical protein KC333_g166 [Hortaea werneckii]